MGQIALLVARAKGQAPKPKRAGRNLSLSLLLPFRKETRGKGIAWLETAEARIGHRGITAFFGEANTLLPGHGTAWPYVIFYL